MDLSLLESYQRYLLHMARIAGIHYPYTSFPYQLPIGSVPMVRDEATYHQTQNVNQPYLPISAPLLYQLQMFELYRALSHTIVPTISTTTASNCPAASVALPPSPTETTSIPFDTEATTTASNCPAASVALPPSPTEPTSTPFDTEANTTASNCPAASVALPASPTEPTSTPFDTVATTTASNCPAASVALPPSPSEPTSTPFVTEASCSTQCEPSTSTQIFHKSISQPQDHVEDKKNKQNNKSTFDNCENKKSVVAPNDKRKHKCEYDNCGLLFLRKSHLKSHIRSCHTGERPYTCNHVDDFNEICGKTFSRTDLLLRHERIHKGEATHICHICSKGFTRSDHLNQHIRTHQNARGRNYQQ